MIDSNYILTNGSLYIKSDDEFVTIEVLVSNDEIGAVIGRNGTIANSIRTLVQAAAYNSEHKKVRINIDSF
jgi:predicted RNA-binding protein YlqC (UPF0109 family)